MDGIIFYLRADSLLFERNGQIFCTDLNDGKGNGSQANILCPVARV